MKIVIDMDEELYELCKRGTTGTFLLNTGMRSGRTFLTALYKAIVNGTPLPKGHGRIADMDDAIKCIEEVTGDDAVYAISLIEWACGKRTIIEAEKGD